MGIPAGHPAFYHHPVASGHEPTGVNEQPCWFCDDDGMASIVSVKDCNGKVHELPWIEPQPEMPCPVCRLGMVLA